VAPTAADAGHGRRRHRDASGALDHERDWPLDTASDETPYTTYPFDARAIAHRFRHSAIFGALDALQPGEAMRFVNDHDPLPLLNQIKDRYGDTINPIYRQRNPGAVMIDFVVVG
jgi:uncharacterized protein (DUF2249 family)